MLEALGVYTSKTFSLFETGEALDARRRAVADALVGAGAPEPRPRPLRHLPAAAPARATPSASASSSTSRVAHYFPELADASRPRRGCFLREVVASRRRRCRGSWMAAGFVHGVLNSDNMNVTGESFDYGPYRFLPRYDPTFAAAYFDDARALRVRPPARGGALEPPPPRRQRSRRSRPRPSVCAPSSSTSRRASMQRYHAKFLDRLGVAAVDPVLDSAPRFAVHVLPRGEPRPVRSLLLRLVRRARERAPRFGGPVRPDLRGRGVARDASPPERLRALAPRAPRRPLFRAPRAVRPPRRRDSRRFWKPIAEADDWTAFDAKIADLRVTAKVFDCGPHRVEDPRPKT